MLPTSNEPDKLVVICLEYLSDNIDLLVGASLPRELCEEFLQIHTQAGRPIDDTFARIFNDTVHTKIKKAKLKKGKLSKDGLNSLLRHKLTCLDVSQCSEVPETLLQQISVHGASLEELSVGSWKRIEHYPGGFRNSPNLKKLEIYKWHDFGNFLTLPILLQPLRKLVSLNLSSAFGVKNLSCLENLPHLKRLILYRIHKANLEECNGLATIMNLKQLTHLDISGSEQAYNYPDLVLASIVESLPNLVYLDISETNLAGRGVASDGIYKTDILGLRSRVGRPLEFLGLYDTKHEACRRHHIPAKIITGDADRHQLYTATKAYIDRPLLLEKVLGEIYNICRGEDGGHESLLEVILEAMDRHEKKKAIQISGSATLFFIVKSRDKIPTKVKRRIIQALLNGMFRHRDDQFMLRNGCLCLCQFKIPQDVMFEYKRLVEILLYTATEMVEGLFIQRIAIYLLNSLACQVDGAHKDILGKAGAVPRMLRLIAERLKQGLCDDVMEVAWSTLWNVTDETAINCQYFLDGDGMDYFIACLEAFPDKAELLRNMMGLLGNVAEVAALRPRLMTERFVTVFTQLLLSESDGIEVSYNAAGVLAHMCSDGEAAWMIIHPSREHVLSVMQKAMDRWDLSEERNINYRSFEPILSLLTVSHTPECQHWAAWALANLTKMYPQKYCKLVETEGGLKLLAHICESCHTYPRIRELAQMVLDNCHRFKLVDYQGVQLDG